MLKYVANIDLDATAPVSCGAAEVATVVFTEVVGGIVGPGEGGSVFEGKFVGKSVRFPVGLAEGIYIVTLEGKLVGVELELGMVEDVGASVG